jgi:hypothetical protein
VSRGPGTASPVEWTWCLDPLQPFSALLDIAAGLTTVQQRPGDEAQTGGPLLNLYLVVCALCQILGDHEHRGFADLTRIAASGRGQRLLRAASRAQHAVHRRRAALVQRGLRKRQEALRALARSLADRILAGERSPGREAVAAVGRLRTAGWPAAVRRLRPRLPESFCEADLHPQDCAVLAARALESATSPRAPLLVVGLRTSGAYLAPLLAAALERLGCQGVELATLRPGAPLLPHEARQVRRVAHKGGWALVVDGAGQNGIAFARAMSALTDLGLSEARICLAAPEIAGRREDWPPADLDTEGLSAVELRVMWQGLSRARSVALRPGEGHVHTLLSDDAVAAWLNGRQALDLLDADSAAVVGGQALPPSGGHLLRRFEVELRRRGGRRVEQVLARGVGLGFFGYHRWLVAACLGDHVPEVLGIRHGVLFTRWEPGAGPPDPVEPEDVDEIAAYVAARARRLDASAGPESWEPGAGVRRVARQVARTCGPAGPLLEPYVADVLDRRLAPGRRTVVDGRMGPDAWVRTGAGGLVKVDRDEYPVEADAARSADPIHDLAGAAIGFRLEPDEQSRLVESYARLTGDGIGLGARLAAHKLQAGWAELLEVASYRFELRTRGSRAAFARELAIRETLLTRTVNTFLAESCLPGSDPDAAGPVWLIRLDGVLETARLGFESASPAALAALRPLLVHGHRVFLVTDLSLGELRERCAVLGAAGGIAEHGSVVWDERRQTATPVAGAEALVRLGRLRDAVLQHTEILVDPRCQHSLHLFSYGDEGCRGVPAADVRRLMERCDIPGLEIVEGVRRTAVRAAGCEEAAAAALLPGDGEPPVTSTLEAVRTAVHGRARTCRQCAPRPAVGAEAELLGLLAIQDLDRLGRLRLLLRNGSLRG